MSDSKIRTFRDALAARIVSELPLISDEQVIVSRRGAIHEKIKLAVSKVENGLAITVGPAAGRNSSESNRDLNFEVSYEIALWFFPILDPNTGEETEMDEEEIRDDIMRAVNGKWQEGIYQHERVTVPSFRPGNDVEANVTLITIQRQHDL